MQSCAGTIVDATGNQKMGIGKLTVGDRIRIIGVPGVGIPDYTIQPETKRAYRKLLSRSTSLRICEIDESGQPWFRFRFKRKDGTWEHHSMCIMADDDNWVQVKHRRKQR